MPIYTPMIHDRKCDGGDFKVFSGWTPNGMFLRIICSKCNAVIRDMVRDKQEKEQ